MTIDGATWGTRTGFIGALLATTCCALPSLLVTLGLGGAVASVVSAVPAVTWLSAHKAWVFAVVGLLLAATWVTLTGRVPTAWLRARVCPAGGPPSTCAHFGPCRCCSTCSPSESLISALRSRD